MLEAQRQGARVIFPDPGQESAPNRFLMTVDSENTGALRIFCDELGKYVRSQWEEIARTVFAEAKLDYSDSARRQIRALPQVFYASEPYRGGEDFGKCYINVIKRLGSAKTLREFIQLDEPYGRKCNLMYEYNALFYREKRGHLVREAQAVTDVNIPAYKLDKYIQIGETLSAPAFVKRCLNFSLQKFDDKFPSVTDVYEMYGDKLKTGDKHGYYTIVMFDGDNMGMWYSEPKIRDKSQIEEFQGDLSRKISEFAAEKSRAIVDWSKRKNGALIYAGGEDFLGALNLRSVFPALKELRAAFGKIVDSTKYMDEKLTFSAGVVIAHVRAPLAEALRMAREAEAKAKSYPGKDAYCLTVAKHSGEVTEFVQPFFYDGNSSLDTLDRLVEVIADEKLSPKFIYQLGTELARIAETDNRTLQTEIFLIEAERILRHSEFPNPAKREETIKEVCDILQQMSPHTDLKNLLMYLRAVAFIARERGAA
jgi:CRISPR-associated protein Cmr2